MERALAGADTGILDLCRPEHSSLAEVWILSEEKSIGNDGADQRRLLTRDIRSFLDFKELVNSKIGQRVLFGFIYPRLSFIET